MANENKTAPSSADVFGVDGFRLDIPPALAHKLKTISDYENRDIPEKARISLQTFAANFISDMAKKQEEYVTKQVAAKVERLVNKYAKENNLTFKDAASKLGLQLGD